MTIDWAWRSEMWNRTRTLIDEALFYDWVRDPDPTNYTPADCDTPWGEEDDEDIRFCTTCQRPRLGLFGEFFAYEPSTRDYPGQSAGVCWYCGECDTEYDCDIDNSI